MIFYETKQAHMYIATEIYVDSSSHTFDPFQKLTEDGQKLHGRLGGFSLEICPGRTNIRHFQQFWGGKLNPNAPSKRPWSKQIARASYYHVTSVSRDQCHATH